MPPDTLAARPPIRVYSRRGCHLCEQLLEELQPLVRDRLALEVLDIDARPEWSQQYGTRIPVVEFEGRLICQYSLDKPLIRQLLARFAGS